jgi:hypothetical protein
VNRAQIHGSQRVLEHFGQFLRGQHRTQHNNTLHRAQELTVRQSTAPEHEIGAEAFLLEFECQNGIAYCTFPT